MKKKPISVPLRRGKHAPKKSPAVAIDGVIHTIRGERVIAHSPAQWAPAHEPLHFVSGPCLTA